MEHNKEAPKDKPLRHHLLPRSLRGIGTAPVTEAISGDVTADNVDAALGNLKAAWSDVDAATTEVMERFRHGPMEAGPSPAPWSQSPDSKNNPSDPTE